MKPKPPPCDAFELFQAHFDQILNPDHALVQLAKKIDWSRFDAAFADTYCDDFGAPAKAMRLMVGPHYLKYMFDESDESVVVRWLENVYGQYFCGYTHMQHECPIHPTSMTKSRNRVGAERLAELLEETIDLAVREKHLSPRDLAQVNVDKGYRGHDYTGTATVHIAGATPCCSRAERRMGPRSAPPKDCANRSVPSAHPEKISAQLFQGRLLLRSEESSGLATTHGRESPCLNRVFLVFSPVLG